MREGTQATWVPTLSVRLKNQKTELPRFQRLMTAFAAENDVPQETLFRVTLSLDEILTNVFRYGYEDDEEHEVSVVATWLDHTMKVEVHDHGIPFNPLEVKTPDTSASLEDRQVGGLGIHIARTMMDDLFYRRELDANILTLTTKPRGS